EGYEYEFGEAWLEIAEFPRHPLIWFPSSERADWCYLCIRPKTHWYHDTYSYNLRPEYQPAFQLEGFGIARPGMAHTRGGGSPELHVQRVPNDLKGLTLTVSVWTYGKGKDRTVGTVRLSRIE